MIYNNEKLNSYVSDNRGLCICYGIIKYFQMISNDMENAK